MILKYISIPELNFSESWENGINKIKCLPRFEIINFKYYHT